MRQESIFSIYDGAGKLIDTGTAKELSGRMYVGIRSIWEDARNSRLLLNEYSVIKTGTRDAPLRELSQLNREIVKCANKKMPHRVMCERFGLSKSALADRIMRLRKRGVIE